MGLARLREVLAERVREGFSEARRRPDRKGCLRGLVSASPRAPPGAPFPKGMENRAGAPAPLNNRGGGAMRVAMAGEEILW